MMRTDQRYTRIRELITDPVIPRLANGNPALCWGCQRAVAFAGGFLDDLTKRVEAAAKGALKGACVKCGSARGFNRIGKIQRCKACRHETRPHVVGPRRKVSRDTLASAKSILSEEPTISVKGLAERLSVNWRTAERLRLDVLGAPQ